MNEHLYNKRLTRSRVRQLKGGSGGASYKNENNPVANSGFEEPTTCQIQQNTNGKEPKTKKRRTELEQLETNAVYQDGYNSGDEYIVAPKFGYWSLERQFTKDLAAIGFRIKRVRGDGACLFRAIAWHIFKNENFHSIVRNLTMDYVLSHRHEYECYLTENFETYVARKRGLTIYGNSVEINAAANAFQCNIEVLEYDTTPKYKCAPNKTVGDIQSISLSYHRQMHYNAVVRAEESDAIWSTALWNGVTIAEIVRQRADSANQGKGRKIKTLPSSDLETNLQILIANSVSTAHTKLTATPNDNLNVDVNSVSTLDKWMHQPVFESVYVPAANTMACDLLIGNCNGAPIECADKRIAEVPTENAAELSASVLQTNDGKQDSSETHNTNAMLMALNNTNHLSQEKLQDTFSLQHTHSTSSIPQPCNETDDVQAVKYFF